MEEPHKGMFDPKNFLAKVGAGKQVLEFHKNQHVFEQGDVADTVFYIQKGKLKVTVLSNQGKGGGCRDVGTRTVRWRGLHEWPQATHLDDDGNGRQRDHFYYQRGDVGRPS